MRILVDENSAVQLVELLGLLLPARHQIDHVTRIGWSGKKDIPLLRDAASKGYNVFLTRDKAQLDNPDETKAIMKAKIHHVRYSQTVDGLIGVGLSMGAIAAAMPLVMVELENAETQRLVKIRRLDHAPRSRFEIQDPRKRQPKYWNH
ncbi:hypothetical protein [Streptacidiphilus carbonis]|jgi:hypothetical protein|uniref:PIN-like domain-containing protein n=1 Tax=Streptacidiphilus carbonis TaxID=105422 RepID=UPI0005AA4844|nr:hypothetical protein [Streptacidiphilus carbonis]